jgi:oligopeptide transport system permease protein
MIGIPLNERKPANLWRDAAIRFSRNKLAVGALFVVGLFFFMAIFADAISVPQVPELAVPPGN